MATVKYRQQTSGSLGAETDCPSCLPSYNNQYVVSLCNSMILVRLDMTEACHNGNIVSASSIFLPGDVLLVTTRGSCDSSPTFECGIIMSVETNPSLPPNYIYKKYAGPYASCNSASCP